MAIVEKDGSEKRELNKEKNRVLMEDQLKEAHRVILWMVELYKNNGAVLPFFCS